MESKNSDKDKRPYMEEDNIIGNMDIVKNMVYVYLELNLRILAYNTIITAFTISKGQTKVIYGMIFSSIEAPEFVSSNKITNAFYCIGPSLMSRDGEYRTKFASLARLNVMLWGKRGYDKVMYDLMNHIMDKISRLDWNVDTECFYPTNKETEEYVNLISSTILSSKLGITLLIGNWYTESYDIIHGKTVVHINKIYKRVMGLDNVEENKKDYLFYKSLIEKYGESTMDDLYLVFKQSAVSFEHNTQIGQKLIPLNVKEVNNAFNIRYKPWREYLIGIKLNSMYYNNIIVNIPYTGSFTFLNFLKKTIFDNYIQYVKLEHSDIAETIIRKLKEAQRITNKFDQTAFIFTEDKIRHEQIQDLAGVHAQTDKDTNYEETIESINEYLSDKFKQLYNKIQDPVDYAQEDIIMSKYGFLFINSYVGRTVYDTLSLIKHNSTHREIMGNMHEHIEIFSKYMFDFIYTLYALNIKCGIIHGDLHLNNCTYNVYHIKKKSNPSVQIYGLSENFIYVFPYNGVTGCIIDFSRAIIQPSFIDSYDSYLHHNDNGTRVFNLLSDDDRDIFNKEQAIRVLHWYNRFFPEFYAKNKNTLQLLTYQHMDMIFPYVAALDTYTLCQGFLTYYKSSNVKITGNHITLLNDLSNTCEKYLLGKMSSIINNIQSFITQKKNTDYANYACLLMFSKYRVDIKTYDFSNKSISTSQYLHYDEIFSLTDENKIPPFFYDSTAMLNKLSRDDIIQQLGMDKKLHNASEKEFKKHTEDKMKKEAFDFIKKYRLREISDLKDFKEVLKHNP
jgi:hypothetical protein